MKDEIVDVDEFIAVKGFKARGKRLTTFEMKQVEFIEPLEKDDDEGDDDDNPTPTENGPDFNGSSYSGDQMSLF